MPQLAAGVSAISRTENLATRHRTRRVSPATSLPRIAITSLRDTHLRLRDRWTHSNVRFYPKADVLTRDQGPTRLPPVLCLSSRPKSFTYVRYHFPRGRMIMSAQSSSATRLRTAAVEPDEMVPARYAQKVGAIDVLVISDGVLPIPSRTIAHNIEPAVRTAWLEHEFLSPEM